MKTYRFVLVLPGRGTISHKLTARSEVSARKIVGHAYQGRVAIRFCTEVLSV